MAGGPHKGDGDPTNKGSFTEEGCILPKGKNIPERGHSLWNGINRDFLGSPVLRTLLFYHRDHRFDPWLGN